MKHKNNPQEIVLLDTPLGEALPQEIEEASQQQPALKELWGLHQKALEAGAQIRAARQDQSISALSTQGYLQKLAAQRAQREREQVRLAWWKRVRQISWSGAMVAASVFLLWLGPQSLSKQVEQSPAGRVQTLEPGTTLASAQRDPVDLWLNRLGGGVLEDADTQEVSGSSLLEPLVGRAEPPLEEPGSQSIPEPLDAFSILADDD